MRWNARVLRISIKQIKSYTLRARTKEFMKLYKIATCDKRKISNDKIIRKETLSRFAKRKERKYLIESTWGICILQNYAKLLEKQISRAPSWFADALAAQLSVQTAIHISRVVDEVLDAVSVDLDRCRNLAYQAAAACIEMHACKRRKKTSLSGLR